MFGEPYERDGVVVIPTATVAGGGGGGSGEGDNAGAASRSVRAAAVASAAMAKPAGVYVISGDTVQWQPAVDVNRIILGGQVVAVVLLLVLRSVLRRR